MRTYFLSIYKNKNTEDIKIFLTYFLQTSHCPSDTPPSQKGRKKSPPFKLKGGVRGRML